MIFESNSQLICDVLTHDADCESSTKVWFLKAIHNNLYSRGFII